MPEAKMIEGEVDACEEMAMTMRMTDEAKEQWIADCIKDPEATATHKPEIGISNSWK